MNIKCNVLIIITGSVVDSPNEKSLLLKGTQGLHQEGVSLVNISCCSGKVGILQRNRDIKRSSNQSVSFSETWIGIFLETRMRDLFTPAGVDTFEAWIDFQKDL